MAEAKVTWSEQQTTLPFKAWKLHATLMDNVPLTTDYIESDYVNVTECSRVSINISVGPSGSVEPSGLTGINYRVYAASDPSSTWYVESTEQVSPGTITIQPATYYTAYTSGMLPFTVKTYVIDDYLRVSVAGVGDPTGAAVSISVVGVY